MKILSLKIIIAIFLIAGGFNQLDAAKSKSVTLVPLNGSPVILIVGGKEKEYYTLTSGTPLKVQVDGPGKLVVLTRLELQAATAEAQPYTVRLSGGKTVLKEQSTQTSASEATMKAGTAVMGKSRKVTFTVPDGSFTYDVSLANTTRPVAVKFMLQPLKGSKKLVSVEPLSYDKVVTATVNESIVAYYVSSRERAVQFRVVGPTKVQISTRLNYDQTMKGKQKYSLTVVEGNSTISQRSLQTTKSTGLSYKEWKEVVPGKPNSISFSVPSGEHTYRVSLGEGAGQSVSLRFSVPKADLKNEE